MKWDDMDVYIRCIKSEGTSLKTRYVKVTDNIKRLEKEKVELVETIALSKELIADEAEKFIDLIQGLLTLAVRKIFFDIDNPKIVIEVKEGARNMASIYYVYNDHEGTKIKSDIRKAVGGGIRAVIGFVLQTFFISYNKLDRIILADEAFKELSALYRPYFIEFLKELCDKHGFKILLITHDEDIISTADYVHKMENGVLHKEV
ncbi:MAG: hypothetical protein ACRC0R_00135 [Cetobacterium sp.]